MNVWSIPCSHLAQSQRLTEEAQLWLKIDAYKYKVMCLGTTETSFPWNREKNSGKQQLWRGQRRSEWKSRCQ